MQLNHPPSTLLGACSFLLSVLLVTPAAPAQPILLGLDADMSLGSAPAGEAIQRGIELAVDEINNRGGVLGRPLALLVRDHRGNPARGEDNIREFAAMKDLVAVVGGLHTPVAQHELRAIHEAGVIYLGPWATGTEIVDNGYHPNFVFRVSVCDECAAGFLVREALKRGHARFSLALENTAWGRSNERAIRGVLADHALAPVEIGWFHWGTADFSPLVNDLLRAAPDVILLVANTPEGLKVIQALSETPGQERVPVISHWGITGGNFFKHARRFLRQIDLNVVQTFSFVEPRFPDRARPVIDAYAKKYSSPRGAEDIFSPVGTAHAYDLVQILALAIEQAQSTDRRKVRDAMETLSRYEGLIRDYDPPFTPTRHDALDESNLFLASFSDSGILVPINYPSEVETTARHP